MKDHSEIQLSFLIPTYNDEETIEELLTELVKQTKKLNFPCEIIVLNDCSTDKTPAILKQLKEHYASLILLNHDENKGYGVTIKELYKEAQGAWMMSLPGDYQFEPSLIHTLLPYQDKADMIIGKRINRNDTQRRLLQSKIYNGLLNLLFQTHISDNNSIRLMKKELVDAITFTTESAFVDAELVIRAKRQGFSIIEVPITHRARETGEATGGKFFKTIFPTIHEMVRFRLAL